MLELIHHQDALASLRLAADVEHRIAAALYSGSQFGMLVTDANQTIIRVNHAFTEITGYTAEEVAGQTPKLFKSGLHGPDFYAAMKREIDVNGTWQGVIWDRRKGGDIFPMWLCITAVRDARGLVTHYVSTSSAVQNTGAIMPTAPVDPMLAELRNAIEQKQFELYYQAQVEGARLTGAEVLVRWLHPQRGLVMPGEFIAFAEATGLILPLGLWILEAACIQLAAWGADPKTADLTVAVNISAKQLHHADFVESVLGILDRTGANPSKLKLELTESVLIANVEETIMKMSTLKSRGVLFSLDDFGTGYSSLSYLKRLPLDQLKIDQGFVRDILVDHNAAITKMIIMLAASLGLTVIAEGVETVEQMTLLAAQGCPSYQGYLFSRPMPIDAFEEQFDLRKKNKLLLAA